MNMGDMGGQKKNDPPDPDKMDSSGTSTNTVVEEEVDGATGGGEGREAFGGARSKTSEKAKDRLKKDWDSAEESSRNLESSQNGRDLRNQCIPVTRANGRTG